MESWVPKGGVPPSSDGAFERFLTAAIATIITIMFSWRMLDKVASDEKKEEKNETGRHKLGYAPPSSLSSSLVSFASPYRAGGVLASSPACDLTIGGKPGRMSQQTESVVQRSSSASKDDSVTRVTAGKMGFTMTSLKPFIRVPVELPLCGDDVDDADPGMNEAVEAPHNEQLTTAASHQDDGFSLDRGNDTPAAVAADDNGDNDDDERKDGDLFFSDSHHGISQDQTHGELVDITDSSLEDVEFIGVESSSDLFLNLSSDSGDTSNNNTSSKAEYRHIINNDNYRPFRVPDYTVDDNEDNRNDSDEEFYHQHGDEFENDEAQPRILDSDEELFCCSMLEPIMEEDSDDMTTSSEGDSSRSEKGLHDKEVEYDLEYEERRRGLLPGRNRFAPKPIYNINNSISFGSNRYSGVFSFPNRSSHRAVPSLHAVSDLGNRVPDLDKQGQRFTGVNSMQATGPDYETITESGTGDFTCCSGGSRDGDSLTDSNVLEPRKCGVEAALLAPVDYEYIRRHGSSVDVCEPNLVKACVSEENVCDDSNQEYLDRTGEKRNVNTRDRTPVLDGKVHDQTVPRLFVESVCDDVQCVESQFVEGTAAGQSFRDNDCGQSPGQGLTSGLRPNPVRSKRPVSDGLAYAPKRRKSEEEKEAFFRGRILSEGRGVAFGEERQGDRHENGDLSSDCNLTNAESDSFCDSPALNPSADERIIYSVNDSPTGTEARQNNSELNSNVDRHYPGSSGVSLSNNQRRSTEGGALREKTPDEIDKGTENIRPKLEDSFSSDISGGSARSGAVPVGVNVKTVNSRFAKGDTNKKMDDNSDRRETDGEETEWEEEIIETFVVPLTHERAILRALQSVKDLLDQRSAARRSELIPRDEEEEVEEASQSTCTTTVIEVEGRGEMGFAGYDDVTGGYRESNNAVARTDMTLKQKMGFELNLDEFKTDDYNTESGWPIVRCIEKERVYVDEDGRDGAPYYRDEDANRDVRDVFVDDEDASDWQHARRGMEDVAEEDEEQEEDEMEEVAGEEREERKEEENVLEEDDNVEDDEEWDEDDDEEWDEDNEEGEEEEERGEGKEEDNDAIEDMTEEHVTQDFIDNQKLEYIPVATHPDRGQQFVSVDSREATLHYPAAKPPVYTVPTVSAGRPLYQRTPSEEHFTKLDFGDVKSPSLNILQSPTVKFHKPMTDHPVSSPRRSSMKAPKDREDVSPMREHSLPTHSATVFKGVSKNTSSETDPQDTEVEDFSSFVSGIPSQSEQEYEEFVRQMSEKDATPSTSTLTPSLDSAILSGNLATPHRTSDVFVFPRDDTSDKVTSPSVHRSSKGDNEDEISEDSGMINEQAVPVKKPRLVRTSTAQNEEELLGFNAEVRRSSTGSVYDESTGILNRSFEETSSSSLALDSEPGGLSRSRSRDGLSRSRSREAILLESPSVEYKQFPESPRKFFSTFFGEPALDVVLESSMVASEEQGPEASPASVASTLSPLAETKESQQVTPAPVKWTRVIPGSNFVEEKRSPSLEVATAVTVSAPGPVADVKTVKSVVNSDVKTTKPITVSDVKTTKPVTVSDVKTTKPVIISDVKTTKPVIISDFKTTKPASVGDVKTAKPVTVSDVKNDVKPMKRDSVDGVKSVRPVDVKSVKPVDVKSVKPVDVKLTKLESRKQMFEDFSDLEFADADDGPEVEVSSPSKVLPTEVSSPSKVLPPKLSSPSKVLQTEVSSSSKILPSKVSSPSKVLPTEVSSPSKVLPPKVSSPSKVLLTEVSSPSKVLPPKASSPPEVLPTETSSPSKVLPTEVSSPSKVLPTKVSSPSKVLLTEVSSPSKVLPTKVSSPPKVLPTETSSPSKVLPTEVSSPSKVLPTKVSSPPKVLPTETSSPSKILQTETFSPSKVLPTETSSPSKVLPTVTSSPSKVLPTVTSSPSKVLPTETSSPSKVLPTATSSPSKVLPTETSSPEKILPTVTPVKAPPRPAKASARPTSIPPKPPLTPKPRTSVPPASPGPRTSAPAGGPEPGTSAPPVSPGPRTSAPPASPGPRTSAPPASPGPRTSAPPASPGPRTSAPPASPGPQTSAPPASPGPRTSAPPASPGPRTSAPPASPGPRTSAPPASPGPRTSAPPASPGPRTSAPPASPGPQTSAPPAGPVKTPTTSSTEKTSLLTPAKSTTVPSPHQPLPASASVKPLPIATPPRPTAATGGPEPETESTTAAFPSVPVPSKPTLAPKPRKLVPEKASPAFSIDRVERQIEVITPTLEISVKVRETMKQVKKKDVKEADVRDEVFDDKEELEEEETEDTDESSEEEADDEEEECEEEDMEEEEEKGEDEETDSRESESSEHKKSQEKERFSSKAVEVVDKMLPSQTTATSDPAPSATGETRLKRESSSTTATSLAPKSLPAPLTYTTSPWAQSQFIPGSPSKPRSMREIKKRSRQPYTSVLTQVPTTPTSPKVAPFVLPENLLTPSRLKIVQSRNRFLSEQNLLSDAFSGEFAARKEALTQSSAPAKDRKYTPKMAKHPNYRSQEQLEKILYMINLKHGRSESSLYKSQECLHDDCILSEKGRREILDKALSIDNLHLDLYRNLQRLGSETDTDGGPLLDTYFPETNSDLFDLTFPFQGDRSRNLERPASMSELRHASDYTTISGSGGGLYDTPESKGKGRFAHKQYKKSKSLCTLETNLDEVNFAASPTGDGLQRVPSAHELRISKSLQKLNVPNWYKQSSLSKSGSCLLKYGSSSSMSSWAFSPSLISSPCTTPSTTSNIVIKSRVQLPSSRNLRSPRFASKSAPSTPSFMNQSTEEKPATPTPVKLPSDKMRTKDKPKALMPIPIVPFDKIRAMFEKKDEQKTQKFQKDEGFATPVSSSTAATKTQAQRPTEIAPSKSFPLNGNDEARYTEEDVVPKVIVSPTDPNVKSILKRPNQEKRYSDIQEAPEADDEPVIVRPVPTKPHEAAPTMPVSQAPTFVSPPQPAKQQPPSKPPIKDKPVLAEKPRPGTAKPEQKEKDEPKPASAPREERTTKKQLKQEGQPSSGSKPKGFAFFRSLRSSSSSSTEDTKDKERKSPREKGIKSSVSPTLSPDSSNDSPEAFPASPFSRLSPTGVQSPPAITITPDTSRPKAPPPYVNVAPGGPRESVTVLESAPVITPPSQKQPAAGPATEERIAQAGSQKEPVRQNVPKNARSPDPIQETNLDDSIEYEIRPAKPEPVVEAASEKKKSWFPKSKLSKTTKPAEESSKPSTKPKVLDLQSKFEIQQLADEPRRLRSPTESASPNGSFVSEGSRSGNVHRESDRSRSPASYSQDGRFAARESDFDQSRDSFSSRSADRSRESDRRDTKLPERKPSEDSDRSFNRSLDQSSDRYPSRDNDHGSARGGKYSDRSAATDSRSGGSDRHISSEDDRRDRSRDSELSRSSDPRDESDRSFDSRDRGHDRDRDFDRSRDYDRRDRDYDDRSRDYNRRDRDYDDRGRDYDRRDRDYDRGRDTDKRDRDYVDRGRDYDRKDKDYDDRSRNFDRRDRNYDDRGTDYDRRDRDFDTRRRERETSPREGSIHSREFDRDSKRGADLDRSSLSRGSAVGSDVTRDSRFRRPSDNYEDVATSRTSLSSGRTWQPKPRGSRGSDSSPPKRVGTATEESTRSPVDSNGTSSPYRYRVAGSAFSSSRPDTAPGLNTPPSGRHEVGPASKSGTAAGAAKSLRETTV